MISLITPNYNGEQWLQDCLDSVASQTSAQEQLEMLFIDDGSTDNSKAIVQGYGERIPGLRPTWHEHTGRPAELRNLAMAQSVGDYVLFLDSDDYLGEEGVERLTDFTRQHRSDVVAFQLDGYKRQVPRSMLKDTIVNAGLVASGLYKTLGIWKMCRKDFLDEKNITFDSTIGRGDDVLFFAEAMLRADSTSVVGGYPFYTVRGREDGSSITQTEWNHQKRIGIARQTGELVLQYGQSRDITNHFLIRLFNADAFAILTSETANETDLDILRSELSEFWSQEVRDLIYTQEAKDTLTRFFGKP